MKRRILIIIVLILAAIIGLEIAFADQLFDKPTKKYAYSTIRVPVIHYNGRLKTARDDLLRKQKLKDTNNPEKILYSSMVELDINKMLETYNDFKQGTTEDIKYSVLTVVGECKNFYITADDTYVDKQVIDSILNKNKKSENYIKLQNEIITEENDDYLNKIDSDGEVDYENLVLANLYWNKLPYNIRKGFIDKGWQIYITDKDLAKTFYPGVYGKVAGVTIYEDKIILIENRTNAIKISVAHEVGHSVDCMLNFKSQSEGFNRIYQKEKEQFVQSKSVDVKHIKGSSIEYFAEGFQQTINFPDGCKENSPITYDFMKKIINTFY